MVANKSSLGLFASFAQALIAIFKMITQGMTVAQNAVDMAAKSVDYAAEEQTIELVIKRKDLRKRLVDNATIQLAKQEEVMQDYGSKSPQHMELLNKIRANLEEDISKALVERKM